MYIVRKYTEKKYMATQKGVFFEIREYFTLYILVPVQSSG